MATAAGEELWGEAVRGCQERLFSLLVLNDRLSFCKGDRSRVVGKRVQTGELGWQQVILEPVRKRIPF